MSTIRILSIVDLPAAEAQAIRALDPRLSLALAPGWFDGEFADTWPEATVRRYVFSAGQGTRAERDAMLGEAEIVLGGWPFLLDLRQRAPRMRWFHQTPAGASNLRGGDIWGSDTLVTTSRGYGDSRAIAEYAVSGYLHFAKGFHRAAVDRAAGVFDAPAYQPRGVSGKRLCVVGAGGIGREVARIAHALGMRVSGTRRHPGRGAGDQPFEVLETPEHLHRQLAECDAVAICCQWTAQTERLIGREALGVIKPGAIVINVARGEIVDEAALLEALDDGRVRGAVLDVYVGEFEHPPPAVLWQHPNVLITPHTSGQTDTRQRRSLEVFRSNLRRYLDGQPLENVIDWELGY